MCWMDVDFLFRISENSFNNENYRPFYPFVLLLKNSLISWKESPFLVNISPFSLDKSNMATKIETQNIVCVGKDIKIRPFVTEQQIKEITQKCFGLHIDENFKPKEYVAYDDRNFMVQGM